MLLPITASAYDAEIDGIYYLFSGDEAIVTFRDHFTSYHGDIVIPDHVTTKDGKTYTVTRIGIDAFESCEINSISLPETIESIGSYAFRCTEINSTELYIPNGVKYIDRDAFSGTKIKTIHLPEGLVYLDYNTFDRCSKLENVNIPSSL